MKSIRNNPAPHLVSGMHYNLERFQELYAWISALQKDNISLTMLPYRFGLLSFEYPTSDFNLELNGFELRLIRCCGFTESGSIIGIFEGVTPPLIFDTNNLEKDGIYEILLCVDTVKRNPIGEDKGDDQVKRLPFNIPKYSFDIYSRGENERTKLKDKTIPVGIITKEEQKENKNFNNEKDASSFKDAIPIGVLSKDGEKVNFVKFVPPSIHVGASDILWKKYLEYEKIFENLYDSFLHLGKVIVPEELDVDMVNLKRLTIHLGNYVAQK